MSNQQTDLSQVISEGGIAAKHTLLQDQEVLVGPATASERNTVKTGIIPVACWRIGDIRFAFDSSLVEPRAQSELEHLGRLIKDHPPSSKSDGKPGFPLSVFGHADPTGDDEYNKQLSGRRATAIYALLTRDTNLWEKLFIQPVGNDKWGRDALRMMLDFVATKPDKETNAVRDEQVSQHERDASKRRQLFSSYMDKLCGSELKLEKQDFLGHGDDTGGKADFQGCGEFNPILVFSRKRQQEFTQSKDKAERDAANAPNRRVMVLIFRKGSRVAPAKWPCPRVNEGVAGCKKRFWSDGEKRRSVQDNEREFKDNEDTFACRFYQRLVSGSPCERGDKPPIVVALFDTETNDRDRKMELVIFDGSDKEIQRIPGAKATDDRAGFFLFRFDPSALPNPVRLQWETAEGERHLAGPCSPADLREALSTLDLKKGNTLIGDPRATENIEPVPTPPSDDVLVNIITEGADGDLPA